MRRNARRLAFEFVWLAGVAWLIYVVYSTFRPAGGGGQVVPVALRPLPLYALYSFSRMLAAYVMSLVFSIAYGYGLWPLRLLLS